MLVSTRGKRVTNYSPNFQKPNIIKKILTPIEIFPKHRYVTVSHGPTFNNIMPQKKPQINYTSLDMSYEVAFDCLHVTCVIFLVGPTLEPPFKRKFRKWNPSSYCKYHQGKGH